MTCASLVAQRLKCLPAMWETWVRSLGWEDPLEKEMAIHSSILAWRIPWTEEPGGLQSTGSKRVGHDWEISLSLSFMTYLLSNPKVNFSPSILHQLSALFEEVNYHLIHKNTMLSHLFFLLPYFCSFALISENQNISRLSPLFSSPSALYPW